MVDLTQYLPILIFLGIAVALSAAFVFLPMGVARLTGAHQPDPAKLTEYECGFPAFEDARSQSSISSRFCSSSSILKRPSSFPGRSA